MRELTYPQVDLCCLDHELHHQHRENLQIPIKEMRNTFIVETFMYRMFTLTFNSKLSVYFSNLGPAKELNIIHKLSTQPSQLFSTTKSTHKHR
jgi:hypothetical protein